MNSSTSGLRQHKTQTKLSMQCSQRRRRQALACKRFKPQCCWRTKSSNSCPSEPLSLTSSIKQRKVRLWRRSHPKHPNNWLSRSSGLESSARPMKCLRSWGISSSKSSSGWRRTTRSSRFRLLMSKLQDLPRCSWGRHSKPLRASLHCQPATLSMILILSHQSPAEWHRFRWCSTKCRTANLIYQRRRTQTRPGWGSLGAANSTLTKVLMAVLAGELSTQSTSRLPRSLMRPRHHLACRTSPRSNEQAFLLLKKGRILIHSLIVS